MSTVFKEYISRLSSSDYIVTMAHFFYLSFSEEFKAAEADSKRAEYLNARIRSFFQSDSQVAAELRSNFGQTIQRALETLPASVDRSQTDQLVQMTGMVLNAFPPRDGGVNTSNIYGLANAAFEGQTALPESPNHLLEVLTYLATTQYVTAQQIVALIKDLIEKENLYIFNTPQQSEKELSPADHQLLDSVMTFINNRSAFFTEDQALLSRMTLGSLFEKIKAQSKNARVMSIEKQAGLTTYTRAELLKLIPDLVLDAAEEAKLFPGTRALYILNDSSFKGLRSALEYAFQNKWLLPLFYQDEQREELIRRLHSSPTEFDSIG